MDKYQYYNPSEVKSPKKHVSNVRVTFDGGIYGDKPYSIARISWSGEEKIAMRWNINANEWSDPDKASGQKKCLGEPSSRGYPTWFVLPNELLSALLSQEGEIAEAVKNALEALKNKK
jgi:hypothetical protein